MKNVKKILLPVDGSEYSMKAAEYAADIAQLVGAEVVPVFCQESYTVGENPNEILEPVVKMLADKGITANGFVVEGSPHSTIAPYAKEKEFDLIVIGARGVTSLEGFLLGSVTQRVLQEAPCPVLTIR